MTQQDYIDNEPKLSFIEISDDNKAVLLNGKAKYSIKLPRNFSRKKDDEKQKIIEDLVYGEWDSLGINYVSQENVSRCAKEATNTYRERRRAAKKKNTVKAKIALQLTIAHSQELFLNEFGRAFAAMKVNRHIEIHPMDEQRFRNWISGIYYQECDDLLAEDDLKKIIRILTARAEFDSSISRHRLDVRVRGYSRKQVELFQNGYDDGTDGVGNVGCVGGNGEITENFDAIYYDLTNKKWESIKITPQGWDIDRTPPILFRRYGSELPQPYPDRDYEPDVLDKFLDLLNLKPEHKDLQKQLLKPDIVSMFYPNTTPKPMLIFPAAQGRAKTTAFELIRHLVDPHTTLTTSLPKEDVNLKQSLAHNYLSFFDNVSEIKDWQSDVLCRAVTGAGDMKRKLFENDDDIIYSYRRIVGVNGITNAITKSDLLDRGMLIELGEIARKDRKLLHIIWRKYLELKPKLLAFCFDIIAEVMKERQKWKGIDEDFFGMEDIIMQKGGLPRMADWAIMAEQISAIIARKEGKPYTVGQFLEAFDQNRDILNTEALKSSLVAEALIAFMTEKEVMKQGIDPLKYGDDYPHWEGSPTMLLAELNEFIEQTPSIKINTKSRSWAQDPAALGREIAQITPNLSPLGIIIDAKRTNKNVLYTITKVPTQPTQDQNSRSDNSQNGVSTSVNPPTREPTPKWSENHAQNGVSAGSVGSVGEKADLEGNESLLELVQRLMRDIQDIKLGYFDRPTWMTFFMTLPNQHHYHCSEDEAEQMLQGLIDDGMIEEFGTGKYRPTEKLRTSGGD